MKKKPLSRSFTHQAPPYQWQNGFPLGNGLLGAMVWGDGNPLVVTLDAADLWDLRVNNAFMSQPDYSYAGLRRLVKAQRFDEAKEIFETREREDNPLGPTKVSVGRVELTLGAALDYECRLDLEHAIVAGTIGTATTTHAITCFVHRRLPVLCLRVSNSADAELLVKPLAEINDGLAKLNHPAPQRHSDGNLHILIQSIPEGPHYAIVWNARGPDYFLTLELAETAELAEAKARATWQEAIAVGFDRMHREHARAWKKFWSVSAVYLPEKRMEFFWHYGIYLLASSARHGSYPPGLQGVWPMDGVMPPWRDDYHADMNVQETFWPAAATGHLELLDVWCDYMKACIEPARALTKKFFGTEGTFWPCCTLPRFTLAPIHYYTTQFSWSHGGWLGWLVWIRWRYSQDIAWLRVTGYPVLSEIFRFYRANLEEGSDSRLHVPLSTSPEYKENKGEAWGPDPNMDLALIRCCCRWIEEMETELGIKELTVSAQAIRAKLAPYALTEKKELCLWPGQPLDESHRHPSQLMAIHPGMDLTIEGSADDRAIVEASIQQYLALGQYRWAGHTYAQLVSMAAVLGRAGWAYECLAQFADHWVMSNGLHCNSDLRNSGMSHYRWQPAPFTMEANCAVAAGISDLLIQGWGDILRIFPAVPAHWHEAAFCDLMAEGAFKVSAIRHKGETVWVRVVANVARTMRLRNPFGKRPFVVAGPMVHRQNDLILAELAKGEKLVLHVESFTGSLKEAIKLVRQSNVSLIGLA